MPRVNDLRRDQRLAVDLFQEVVHQGLVGAKDSCGDSMARQFGPHGTALGQAFEEPDFHRGAPTSLGAQFPHQAIGGALECFIKHLNAQRPKYPLPNPGAGAEQSRSARSVRQTVWPIYRKNRRPTWCTPVHRSEEHTSELQSLMRN